MLACSGYLFYMNFDKKRDDYQAMVKSDDTVMLVKKSSRWSDWIKHFSTSNEMRCLPDGFSCKMTLVCCLCKPICIFIETCMPSIHISLCTGFAVIVIRDYLSKLSKDTYAWRTFLLFKVLVSKERACRWRFSYYASYLISLSWEEFASSWAVGLSASVIINTFSS